MKGLRQQNATQEPNIGSLKTVVLLVDATFLLSCNLMPVMWMNFSHNIKSINRAAGESP